MLKKAQAARQLLDAHGEKHGTVRQDAKLAEMLLTPWAAYAVAMHDQGRLQTHSATLCTMNERYIWALQGTFASGVTFQLMHTQRGDLMGVLSYADSDLSNKNSVVKLIPRRDAKEFMDWAQTLSVEAVQDMFPAVD